MTDSHKLLLVVAAIYLMECSIWTDLRCVAFTSWLPRKKSLCNPDAGSETVRPAYF
jgi:hypothetical protein